MKKVLQVERAIAIRAFDQLRQSKECTPYLISYYNNIFEQQTVKIFNFSLLPNPFEKIPILSSFKEWSRKTTEKVACFFWVRYWRLYRSYREEIFTLEMFNYATQLLQNNDNDALFHSAEIEFMKWSEKQLTHFAGAFVSSMWTGSIANSFNRIPKAETLRQLAITAIAIRRYEIQHNQLPSKLEQLVPDYLSTVPIDPMSGQPLRYGFGYSGQMLLYSIGCDGVDDHGDPSPPRGQTFSKNIVSGKDWVWPTPVFKRR